MRFKLTFVALLRRTEMLLEEMGNHEPLDVKFSHNPVCKFYLIILFLVETKLDSIKSD